MTAIISNPVDTRGGVDNEPDFGAMARNLLGLGASNSDNKNSLDIGPMSGRPINSAICEAQYDRDSARCRMTGLRACWAQAAARYSACLHGDPIPPLIFGSATDASSKEPG
jgi:hypothetical protein